VQGVEQAAVVGEPVEVVVEAVGALAGRLRRAGGGGGVADGDRLAEGGEPRRSHTGHQRCRTSVSISRGAHAVHPQEVEIAVPGALADDVQNVHGEVVTKILLAAQ